MFIVVTDYTVGKMKLDDTQKMSVVSSMVRGSSGLWIGTDNGL